MPSPATTKQPARPSRRKHGFALVLTLLVVSFLVVLLLVLTTLVRVETSAGAAGLKQALARAQARYALAVALGETQRLLGPDAATTAPAGPTSAAAPLPHPRWTGAWSTDGAFVGARWLVSGENPNPANALDPARAAVLAGARYLGTAGTDPVLAPLEPSRVTDLAGNPTELGNVAWWVADEGIKLPLHVGDPVTDFRPTATNRAFFNGAPGRFGLQQPGRPRFDRFAAGFDPASPGPWDTRPANDTLHARADLGDAIEAYPRANALATPLPDALATSWSANVELAGATPASWTGGRSLKANLTDETFRDDLVTDTAAKVRALRVPAAQASTGDVPVNLGIPTPADPAPLRIAPIPTEIMLRAGLFASRDSSTLPNFYDLRIRYNAKIELWNPYSVPLRFQTTPSSPSNYQTSRIQFLGMPTLRITKTILGPQGGGTTIGPFKLDELDRGDAPETTFNTWLEVHGGGRNLTLLPGEVYSVVEPSESSQARGLVRMVRRNALSLEDNSTVRAEFVHPKEGMTIRFIPYVNRDLGYDHSKDPAFFEITGIPFEDFTLEYAAPYSSGAKPFITPSSSYDVTAMFTFAYHLQLNDSLVAKLMTLGDPRRTSWKWAETVELANGERLKVSDLFESLSLNPADMVDYGATAFSKTGSLLYDLAIRTDRTTSRTDLRIYDLPVGPVWSLHWLRGAPLGDAQRSAFLLGEKDGGTWNGALDRYFFSGITRTPTGDSGDSGYAAGAAHGLMDPRLLVLPDTAGAMPGRDVLAGANAASRVLRRGALNVNSPLWQPWRAVLGSRAETYRTPAWGTLTGVRTLTLDNAFPRFVYGDGHVNPLVTDAEVRTGVLDAGPAARQGLRRLDGAEGSLQLDQLAARIAAALRARRAAGDAPFASLAEFAASGIVGDAIDAVGPAFVLDGTTFPAVPEINGKLADGQPEAPRFAPGYLTQGDVLLRAQPALAPRSDTFRLRSYGEVTNPVTGEVEGRAWAEAIVQRLPERRDGGDPVAATRGAASARRFEVVSFRWLRPEEL